MGGVVDARGGDEDVSPYVPRLVHGWTPGADDHRHMRVRGTLAFVDISGFTRLTERLARKGNVGAEEMSDLLSATFADLLTEAYDEGADLVKWGGDAVLLLFRGPGHAPRAARAAHRMRARLTVVGHLTTTSGPVALRMSVGVHSGAFDFFLVGDPSIHRELLISGPAASVTAETEAAAAAGQIGLSAATAALLDPRSLGTSLGDGRLLRSAPPRTSPPGPDRSSGGPDPLHLLPPPIRSLLLSGTVEAEHRLITVAFVQYSGADGLLLASGAAALAEALDEVVRNVQVACAAHDVTFFETDINRDGGKIMLTAGAPRSAHRDEQRMLLVARAVLERAGRLPLRIGINRGHVFTGDFGAPFRRTYSVKGDAINLAARVMAKALPGQALATTEVLSRSPTVFRTTELPPFTVKGKAKPVLAAAVGERLGTRAEERPSAPLVGRTAELAALDQAVLEARSGRGRGRVVEVVGDAGMGKSRLVAEALGGRDDVHVLASPCEEYESSTPYFPFRRLLRDLLGVGPGAGPVEVAEALAGRVADTPHLLPWLPLLGIPMDVALPPTRETSELDEQFRKTRLEEVVAELLGSVVTEPTAVVVEDVHLMDAASADLVQRLVEDLGSRPLLVVVTRRDQGTGLALGPAAAGPRLTLGPLTEDDATTLVRTVPSDRPLTPQAAAAVVRRGGGNPMFLEALTLEAVRAGSVGRLPESVEGLVTSQLDRLAPADRTVVRYAAVFGTAVDEKALLLLLETHPATVPAGALTRLADFLERDDQGLRFRNALTRDVAYEALPFTRRRALHDHVGDALERAAASPEDLCELLSVHFFHAGHHERAWQYSVLAAERAVAKYAHGEAIEFFARAAQSGSHVSSVTHHELARVHERLADSRWLVGMTTGAADAYAAARRHARGDPVRLAAIIEKEARIDQRRRKHSVALRRISVGLNRLRDVAGPEAAVARSLLARRYANSRFNQGRVEEALHWAQVAAQEAEDAVDKDALAQAYEALSFVYASSNREEPLPYGRIALQAYVELDNLSRQGHCLNNLAVQEYNGGRWQQSLDLLEQASETFRRTGDTASEANALYNRVELLVRQRRAADAAPLVTEVLRTARAVEDDELVALAVREQARTAALAGEGSAALALLEQARAMFVDLQESAEVRTTDVVRAEVLLDAGRAREAAEVLDSVTDTTDPPDATVDRLLGRQHLAEGRLAEARVVLEVGLEAAGGAADRYEQGLLLLALADLTRREGAPTADLEHAAHEVLGPMGVRGLTPCSPACPG